MQIQPTYRQNLHQAQNTSFKGLEGIIFDADGTMVHSGPYHEPAWLNLSLKYRPKNVPLDYTAGASKENRMSFELHKGNGTTEEMIRHQYGNSLSLEQVKTLASEKDQFFFQAAKGKIQEVTGLSKFLETIKNIKKGIATCASPASVDFYVKTFNLAQHFNTKHIVDASKVTKGKPDPEVYLKAAKALNIKPQDCLVFEDSDEGIKAALRAGMKVIGVSTGLSKDELLKRGANLAIKDYTEITLPKIISLF